MTKKKAKSYKVIIKVGVIIRQKTKVLLIRERHNPTDDFKWNIVKGTFEPEKDRSLIEAAKRESKEEADANIKLKYFLSTYYLLDNGTALIMFTFVANLLNSKVRVLPKKTQAKYSSTEKIAEVKLFSKEELRRLKPKDFVGMRGYLAIQDYLKGVRTSLNIIQTLPPK